MRVHELAKELGVESAQVIELLGGGIHHTAVVDDEAVDMVCNAINEAGAATPEASEPSTPEEATPEAEKPQIVRFWSEVMKHAFVLVGELHRFENYKVDTYVVDPATGLPGVTFETLKELARTEADIRIVVDKPFKDLGDRKRFRDLLTNKLFTGPNHEASALRGMGFVEALFKREEHAEIAKVLHELGPAGLVELAVERKSYKDSL